MVKRIFFLLIPRSWVLSKPEISMKSLGNFLTKQFCFQKMLFHKYFGFSFLTGIPKKLCLDLWHVAANPSACVSPSVSSQDTFATCPAVCTGGKASALVQLLQSQKFQFCAFEGISELGSGRPQRFRGLGLVSVGLHPSHRH